MKTSCSVNHFILFIILMQVIACGSNDNGSAVNNDELMTVRDTVLVEALADDSFLCLPADSPPFAGVLYNHGGLGDQVGGDLEATCAALAEAGYVALSKKRRETIDLEGHLDDLQEGLTLLIEHQEVATDRIAVLGFSRGGLLAFQASLINPDFNALVLMAPASGNGALEQSLMQSELLDTPALILVAENDTFQDNHVALAELVNQSLQAENKESELIIYPPYANDGHTLFFTVNDIYWQNILDFLSENL